MKKKYADAFKQSNKTEHKHDLLQFYCDPEITFKAFLRSNLDKIVNNLPSRTQKRDTKELKMARWRGGAQ